MLQRRTVIDSTGVKLMIPTDGLPVYFFPPEDVSPGLLEPGDKPDEQTGRGLTRHLSLRWEDRVVADSAWMLVEPAPELADLRGMVALRWKALDSWWEEDDEVYVHPRSPYHRIDVLHSSRHLRIEVDGQVLAESRRPRLLFETGLPTRYYLPQADVRLDLLTPSLTVTQCPYKGMASYWSSDAVRDVAWMYRYPIPECPKIESLIAFFNERCDIFVDGQLQPRPRTPWS